MKIKFTQTRTTKEAKPQTFKEGEVHDLPEPSANHWINRGAAVEVEEEKAKAKTTKVKDAPDKEDEGEDEPGADKDKAAEGFGRPGRGQTPEASRPAAGKDPPKPAETHKAPDQHKGPEQHKGPGGR
jgi:hypothetical protein